MLVTRQKLESTIHVVPKQRLVYLNNAKVACSSIKKALWLAFDPASFTVGTSPHNRVNSPFCRTLEEISANADKFQGATFFTVVRNPYTRILSAYLDKISTRNGELSKFRDAAVWHPFCRRYRLSADTTLTFGEFLTMVVREDPSLVDQHFGPQYINILTPFMPFDFIGHMEQMPRVWSFLSDFGVTEEEHRPHRTKANTSLKEFYGPNEIQMVRSFYSEDFRLFGYSDDPNQIDPVSDARRGEGSLDRIITLIQCYTAPDQDRRQKCIAAVGNVVPSLVTDFIALESDSVQMAKLVYLTNGAIRGDIQNWKLVARIGEELLRNNMVYEAASVTHRAKVLMYGS